MDNVILLADRNSRAWDFAEKIREYIQEKKRVFIPLIEVSIEHFRNGEIKMHVLENMRKKHIYFIHDSMKNPQEWWIELLLVKDLLLSASAESITFVLPNMLYSRQDRKDKPHVPISARALAKSISSGLKKIITMDLHVAQVQGFYSENMPLDNLYSFPEAVRYLKEKHPDDLKDLVIVSPDVGSADRAKAFLQRLERAQQDSFEKNKYSFALISKTRSRPGEVEHMQLIGDVTGKNVLIIDDMIDTGGTLLKAAELLREKGAEKLFCYATHGIFTMGTEEICKAFDRVMVSNTHYREDDGLEVIDFSPVFAEAIYRAQMGLSISKLFE